MVLVNYVIMCIVFGTTFLAIKVGVDAGAPPFFSAGVRFVLAGLLILMWMTWKKRASFSLLLHKEMWLTGLGLTFGTFSMLYWAEQYVSSGTAAILSATAPIIIIMLQAVVYHERVAGKKILGCLIGLAGVIVLVLPQLSIKSGLFWLLGCMAILIGQLFYSGGALYSKQVIRRFANTSPIALNAAQMLCGGVMLLILSLFTERVHIESMLAPEVAFSLLYLIVIGSMVGHTIFYWLVAKTNPLFPSTWLYISPMIAMIIGNILYNEAVSWFMAAGAVATIIGIIFVNTGSLGSKVKVVKINDDLARLGGKQGMGAD
ncbi:Permease of the drug/metabolite transporter (DMT) superfamily [Paenibacillus uliginis N3/975]|uniref:Permease of the drug/metabolite transporter (DMT) superfamily n=1 Tax=Paenibacillus uliginis N3/975 TaxID=1313296 RepID=A0A1X7HIF0_9BACL|nr:EamA family transporter [Paenibacillus uliginis]SMF86884.1 Permease of the drug/metabolite transporter (DMT) superfamily [Paenibacillus uliginis N3/975]